DLACPTAPNGCFPRLADGVRCTLNRFLLVGLYHQCLWRLHLSGEQRLIPVLCGPARSPDSDLRATGEKYRLRPAANFSAAFLGCDRVLVPLAVPVALGKQ